jgi:hypothetical protein
MGRPRATSCLLLATGWLLAASYLLLPTASYFCPEAPP